MSSYKYKQFFNLLIDLSKILNLNQNQKWLEIGCGNGNLINYLIQKEKNCIGIDVEFKNGPYTKKLEKNCKIKKISTDKNNRINIKRNNDLYTWPCEDKSFGISFSSSVIEHVMNIKEFARENSRILTHGGFAIHYFPSRTAIIEAHTGIPFGGVFINKKFYKFMIFLGLSRNGFKDYQQTYKYMKNSTNYLTKSKIIKNFSNYNLKFIGERNDLIIKHIGPIHLKKLSKFKIFVFLFGIFRSKILIFKKI
tara:strand:+ start:301 stop:1053 length:753 start_codon:yes stop_codon:yes gene_type:complete